jgi:hypothetical protein
MSLTSPNIQQLLECPSTWQTDHPFGAIAARYADKALKKHSLYPPVTKMSHFITFASNAAVYDNIRMENDNVQQSN